MRVLHVSEALGGGITTAVVAMVEATPEVEHHLLARMRTQHDVGIDPATRFGSVATLPADPVRAVLALRRAVKRLRPHVVHAHSSVAGVVARTAGLEAAVVYSPHCFAFERQDVSTLRRRLFRGIEAALTDRTDLFAAVAPHELDLAAELGHQHLAYVPNRVAHHAPLRAHHDTPLRIAAVGRVCPQKDWPAFLRLRRYVATHLAVPTRWTWIGGGDAVDEDALRAADVEVTGWLDHEALLHRLADQQVYLHTAAWEAAPISILEAADLGLPMAVQSIPSLDSLDVPGRRSGVLPLAERIASLADPRIWRRAQEESLAFAAQHDEDRQAEHLLAAYASACGRPAPRSTMARHSLAAAQ